MSRGSRLEGQHLLGEARGRVVAVGHEVDAVADCGERGCGGLSDRGDLRALGDRRPVGVEHIDRRRAGERQPVEAARLQVVERLLERRRVVAGREVDQRGDHRHGPAAAQGCRDAVAPGSTARYEHAPPSEWLGWRCAAVMHSWGRLSCVLLSQPPRVSSSRPARWNHRGSGFSPSAASAPSHCLVQSILPALRRCRSACATASSGLLSASRTGRSPRRSHPPPPRPRSPLRWR